MKRLVALALVMGMLAPAAADPARDAEQRAAAGDFVGAAAKFREAYAATSKPELMCNVGIAFYKANDLPRAHLYLQQCQRVGTSLEPAFMQSVNQVVAAVEGALAKGNYTPVSLTVEPAAAIVTVAGGQPFDEVLPLGQRLWFPRGTYELVVTASGHREQRRQLVAATATPVALAMSLVPEPAERAHAPVTDHASMSPKRKGAYITAGAGVLLLAGGVVFGVRARSLSNDVEAACAIECDWAEIADKDASGRQAQTTSFILYGASALALGASVWFYVTSRREEKRSIAVVPQQGGAMATWTGAW